ncbi:MAG: 3-oxoacyl-ACP synthase [Bacteroidota bacterium]
MPSLKSEIHKSCQDLLETKIKKLESRIADLQAANSEDTKSSAGDKFETSREMNKGEIEKSNLQLRQFIQMKSLLAKSHPEKEQSEVAFGALVKSNEGMYYFAVPLGKIELEKQSCFALSLASPIGKALLGKKAGEEISFMNRQILLEAIS